MQQVEILRNLIVEDSAQLEDVLDKEYVET